MEREGEKVGGNFVLTGWLGSFAAAGTPRGRATPSRSGHTTTTTTARIATTDNADNVAIIFNSENRGKNV